MATSPNYAWAEPDNSSLVKNGAADIRTLGDAIDTSLWNSGYGQAGKNKIINGDFGIWQRGTSITSTAAYTVDRYLEANGTNSIVYTRSTDVPTNSGFAYSVSRAGTGSNMAQRIEAAQSVVLAGQTATLSFWYKSTVGADNFNIVLYYANSADNFAAVTQIGSTQTIATPSTSWVKVSYTYSIPANGANGLAVYFYRGAGATSTTLMTGVQLEIGAVATPFARAGGSIGGELAMCQRYFAKSYLQADAPATATSTNSVVFVCPTASTGSMHQNVRYPITMRTTPTITLYDQVGASGKVYKGANGKTSDVFYTGDGGFAGGTTDATSTTLMVFQYTASAEL